MAIVADTHWSRRCWRAFLATILGLLLAMSCATFGRPALEVDARARITQEGILAAQSIACDLGGFLADSSGRTGTSSQYDFPGGTSPKATFWS